MPKSHVARYMNPHSHNQHPFLAFTLFLTLGLLHSAILHAQMSPPPDSQHSEEDLQVLKGIQTIFIGGRIKTWLDLGYPPYDAVSLVKMRLEEAGFQVVFHPNDPHDATLVIEYTETPSGVFRLLEQATSVEFKTTLYHEKVGVIYTNHFTADPDQVPVGSLYWDTINKLEEKPRYYYQGHILKAWLMNQANSGSVLIRMARRPYTDANYVKPDERPGKAFLRRRVRFNTIREIGKIDDPQARETLWELTKLATPEERKLAVEVLGGLGDATFIPKLSDIAKTDQDPDVQLAAKNAIQAIEEKP